MMACASPALAGPALRGVQLHSLWYDVSYANMDRELDLAAAAGSTVVRIDVVWGSLETTGKGQLEGTYEARLAHFMKEAAARGMKVVATLWSTPCWASTAPESLKQGCTGAWWDRGVGAYPPKDPADYAAIAHWLTATYGDDLAALEIWNEPNNALPGNAWQARDKVASYAALVRAAYPAAKRGDPRVPVIIGALSFADKPFLEALYAAGLGAYEDGISVHPYNEWRDPADPWQPEWRKYTFTSGLQWVHDAMVAHGDSSKIWVTEFGWTIGTGDRWTVTPEQQAAYVAGAFDILAGLDYVAEADVYNLVATSADPASFEGGFGLLNADYSPRPAYAALTAALHGSGKVPARAKPKPKPHRKHRKPRKPRRHRRH
jgi:hypothetical protein